MIHTGLWQASLLEICFDEWINFFNNKHWSSKFLVHYSERFPEKNLLNRNQKYVLEVVYLLNRHFADTTAEIKVELVTEKINWIQSPEENRTQNSGSTFTKSNFHPKQELEGKNDLFKSQWTTSLFKKAKTSFEQWKENAKKMLMPFFFKKKKDHEPIRKFTFVFCFSYSKKCDKRQIREIVSFRL